MHDYFSKSADRLRNTEILTVDDLINYRMIDGERAPFKFRLQVSPQADNTFLSSINVPVDILVGKE